MTSPARAGRSADVDPRLFAAVSNVVSIVLEQQREREAEEDARQARKAKPPRPAIRRLYDVRGAADQLSLSEAKVWALIKAGRLRPGKVDGRTLISATELDRFAVEELQPG